MIDLTGIAPIEKALGQSAGDPQAAIDLAQEQRSAVTGEITTGKIRDHFATTQVLKKKRLRVTVCRGTRGSLHIRNWF